MLLLLACSTAKDPGGDDTVPDPADDTGTAPTDDTAPGAFSLTLPAATAYDGDLVEIGRAHV